MHDVRHIFAYGSLMWRPDFAFVSARKAIVHGYHRRLCVYSHHYRGTAEKLGLVLGLDLGGACSGVLYEIAPENWPVVLAQVRAREMIGAAYDEMVLPTSVEGVVEKLNAIAYVVRTCSDQYAPRMSTEETLKFIRQGHGLMGSCRDYVASTIRHLRELEIHEPELEAFAPNVLGS